MLDYQDIEIIRTALKEEIIQNNQNLEEMIGRIIDRKIEENNQRLEEMIDRKIEEKIKENNQRLKEMADQKFTENNEFIFEEMDRYYRMAKEEYQPELKKLNREMDEISEYYRIKKLEDDNTRILLNLCEKNQREIDEIRRKLAV